MDFYFTNGFNKKQACISAGYAEGTAHSISNRVFGLPQVKQEIEKRMKALAQKAELNAQWVIDRMMAIADSGRTLAPYKKVQEDGSILWDFTGASEEALALLNEISVDYYTDGRGDEAREVKKFKVGVTEPKAALDSLARHLGMFKDSVDVNHTMGVTDRLMKGRERVRKLNAPEAGDKPGA